MCLKYNTKINFMYVCSLCNRQDLFLFNNIRFLIHDDRFHYTLLELKQLWEYRYKLLLRKKKRCVGKYHTFLKSRSFENINQSHRYLLQSLLFVDNVLSWNCPNAIELLKVYNHTQLETLKNTYLTKLIVFYILFVLKVSVS